MSNVEDQLAEKAGRVLDLLINGIEKTGDVAQQQLPGLIDEYVKYLMVDAISIFGPALVIMGTLLWAFVLRKIPKDDPECDEVLIGLTAAIVFVFLMGTFVILDSVKDIVKLSVSPKAAIIETLRKK